VTHLFEFAANEAEGLEDCGGGAADGDDSLRARAIGNVDFGSRLEIRAKLVLHSASDSRRFYFRRTLIYFSSLTHLFSETLDYFALLADDATDFLQHTQRQNYYCTERKTR